MTARRAFTCGGEINNLRRGLLHCTALHNNVKNTFDTNTACAHFEHDHRLLIDWRVCDSNFKS
jgi:hypothetical protein